MHPLDSRLQLAAVTLAEELNFSRAADRLRITQPALSKQIAELEDRLGIPVFRRLQRRVELTEAGEVLVRGCRDSFEILDRAIRLAKNTYDSADPLVTVGHSPYIDPALVELLISVHLPLYPGLRLRIESMFSSDLAHSVLVSELDMAIMAEPAENPLLTRVKLGDAPLHVLMPADHPASSSQSVGIEEFSGVGWMLFPRRAHPPVYDRFLETARSAGVAPIELHHYTNPQEVVPLIHENFGVAFLTKGAAGQLRSTTIVSRPLAHPAFEVTNYLIMRADQSARYINEFGRAFLKRVAHVSQYQSGPRLQLMLHM